MPSTGTLAQVEALLDGLLALVKSALQKELRSTANSSVLVLKQLLEQAENAGAKVIHWLGCHIHVLAQWPTHTRTASS